MIGYLRWLGTIVLGAIIMMIAAGILYIIGFVILQITKRICEGIEKGMDDR